MTKRTDTWMPLYIGDYLADTGRLTTEGHGAYLLLLMDYWRNGPPPADDEQLAAIARLPIARWKKIKPALEQFFHVGQGDGLWHQKRADEERLEAGQISDKRTEAGKAGASARWAGHDGKRIANRTGKRMAKRLANDWQNDAPSPSPSQSPREIPESLPETPTVLNPEPVGPPRETRVGNTNPQPVDDLLDIPDVAEKRKATRLPADFQIPLEWFDDGKAARQRANLPAIALQTEAEKFTNHWLSKAGKDAAKLDWKRTWINWCLTASAPRGGAPGSGGRQGMAELQARRLEREIEQAQGGGDR